MLKFAALLLASAPAPAFASGYEFEGVGTRHVSRAGAATADADDWSAGYWNPASLPRAARGGREFGAQAFGGWAYARDTNSLSNLPGLGGIFRKERMVSGYALGALGALAAIGEDQAVGVTVYTPLLQGANFMDASAGGTRLDLRNSAGIVVTNVSYGRKLTETVSAGAGIGALHGRIQSRVRTVNPPLLPGDSINSDFSGDGWGWEGTFGLRWDPSETWTAAAVYRTGADIDVFGHATASSLFLGHERSDFHYSLRQPPTSDVGLAWRPGSGWTFTSDLHSTYWKRFTGRVVYARTGNLLTNQAETLRWRDTWKLRFGVKKALGKKTELLAGYSYDRPAVDPGSVDLATTIDAPMHRLSAGASRWLTERLQAAFGAIAGYGYRAEGMLRYQLSGLQLMGEARLRF